MPLGRPASDYLHELGLMTARVLTVAILGTSKLMKPLLSLAAFILHITNIVQYLRSARNTIDDFDPLVLMSVFRKQIAAMSRSGGYRMRRQNTLSSSFSTTIATLVLLAIGAFSSPGHAPVQPGD